MERSKILSEPRSPFESAELGIVTRNFPRLAAVLGLATVSEIEAWRGQSVL